MAQPKKKSARARTVTPPDFSWLTVDWDDDVRLEPLRQAMKTGKLTLVPVSRAALSAPRRRCSL